MWCSRDRGALSSLQSQPGSRSLLQCCCCAWLDADSDDVQDAIMDLGVRSLPCLVVLTPPGTSASPTTSSFDVKDWSGALARLRACVPDDARAVTAADGVPRGAPSVSAESVAAAAPPPPTVTGGVGASASVNLRAEAAAVSVVASPYGFHAAPVTAAPAAAHAATTSDVVVAVVGDGDARVDVLASEGQRQPLAWAATQSATAAHTLRLVPESSDLIRTLTAVVVHKWTLVAYVVPHKCIAVAAWWRRFVDVDGYYDSVAPLPAMRRILWAQSCSPLLLPCRCDLKAVQLCVSSPMPSRRLILLSNPLSDHRCRFHPCVIAASSTASPSR